MNTADAHPRFGLFISYASSDAKPLKVHCRLVTAGILVLSDKLRLQPAFTWHREIEACRKSRESGIVITIRNLREPMRWRTNRGQSIRPTPGFRRR
jgi:hypothetical protein